MATTESEKTVVEAPPPPEVAAEVPPPEVETVEAPPPPPPEVKITTTIDLDYYIPLAEIVLRFLLFASALVAVVVMVTSKQTKGGVSAKFNYSPAFIYFVAALSVAGLYGITTALSCLYNLLFKPADEFFKQALSYFIVFDVILLGIVASATGAAGSFSYIGLKGNSHVNWNKICSTYDVFCKHVGSSAFVSLFASVLLVFLVLLSVCPLSKKSTKVAES